MDVLKSFTAVQNHQFTALQLKMEEIKEQNTKLQDSADFNAAKYDEITLKLQQMEQERKDDRVRIMDLEEKIEQLERQHRSTSLEIRNVPQKAPETKQDLQNTLVTLGNLVKSPVQSSDIKDVFRIQTKSQNKTIIAEFNSVITKERMMKAIKIFNKENKNDKLNTSQLQFDGPKQPIYVSENLTPKNKRLFYLARDFSVLQKYRYCWTSFGKVLLRKEDGAPVIRINSEHDFRMLDEKQ